MEVFKPWVLSIEQTQWQFRSKFNILTLAIVRQGVVFP